MSKLDRTTKSSKGILLITRPTPQTQRKHKGSGDRSISGIVNKAGKAAIEYVQVSSDFVEAQLKGFLSEMDTILQSLPSKVGTFELESMELSVEITAKGSIGLLGSGGEIGGKGGLTFKLKRKGA